MAIPESQAIQIAHADAANYYPDLDTAYAVGPPYGSGTPYTSYDSGLNRWTVRFDLLEIGRASWRGRV